MRSTSRNSTPAWAEWVTNYTWPGEFLSFFLSFFLSRVANTQLNHWTKRVVSTREWLMNDTWMRVWVTNYTWMRNTSRNYTPAEWVTNYTWMREWVTNCKRTLNASLSHELYMNEEHITSRSSTPAEWVTNIPECMNESRTVNEPWMRETWARNFSNPHQIDSTLRISFPFKISE